MAYFTDSGPPALPDLSEGISKIGDALTQTLAARRQQQQFDAKMKFDREQEARKAATAKAQQDYENRGQDERNLRDRATFAQNTAEFERKAGSDITQHLADADVQGATAIAARTPHFDPATGKTTYGTLTPGPMRDVGPEPVAAPASERPAPAAPPPAAAMPAGPPPMQGPVLTPEAVTGAAAADTFGQAPPEILARKRALEAQRGREQADRAVAVETQRLADSAEGQRNEDMLSYPSRQAETRGLQRKFDASQAEVPAAHDQWLREKRSAENEVPYKLQFGNEAPVTLDVQTQRYQHRSANADDFLASHAGVAVTERDKAALRAAHAAILDGLPIKDAEKQFQAERVGIAKEGMTRELAGEHNDTTIEAAKIAAASRASVSQADRNAGDRENKDRLDRTDKDLKDWLKSHGATEVGDQMAQVDEVLKKLHGNGRDQQTAFLELMRSGIGKSNRLNQYIEKRYGPNLGLSSTEALGNKLEQMWSGETSGNARAMAIETATELKRRLAERSRQLAGEGVKHFTGKPEYDPNYAQHLLEQRLPGFESPPETQGGAPPELRPLINRSKKTTVKGMPDEEILKRLGVQ